MNVLHPDQLNEVMNHVLEDIKTQINDSIEFALGEGIKKGFIQIRQSDPVIIKEKDSDTIKLHHSICIDYLGAEKIDQLEKQVAELQKINSDLHSALTEFYEKARPNRWLMRNQNQK